MDETRNITFDNDGQWYESAIHEMDISAGSRGAPTAQAPKVKSIGLDDAPEKKPAATPKRKGFDMSEFRKTAVKSSTMVEQSKMPKPGEVSFGKVKEEVKEGDGATLEETVKETAPAATVESITKEQTAETTKEVVKEPEPIEVQPQPVEETSTQETVEKPESADELVTPVAEEELKPAIDFKKMNLSKPSVEKPAETVQEKAEEKPVEKVEPSQKDIEAGFTGTGFKVVPFADFIKEVNLTEPALLKWCKKCITAASISPAALFSMKIAPKLRFYNLTYTSSNAVPVLLGYGDSVSYVAVDVVKMTVADLQGKVRCNGEQVSNDQGRVMAVYAERLRIPRVV